MRWATAVYCLALLVLLGLVFGPGERLWPVTLFLLGPRWLVALPLVALLPAALLLARAAVVPLLLAGLLLAGPLLGLCIPWRTWWDPAPPEPRLRVLTWNVGGSELAPGDLGVVLALEQPHVALLQECATKLLEQGEAWHTHHDGGMCLLSRLPILDTAVRDREDMWQMAGSGALVRYALESPLGSLHVTNAHLETPREGLEAVLGSRLAGVPLLEAKYRQRAIEARLARRWADASPGPLRAVAGDFNATVESDLFRDHWQGYRDCFSEAGLGLGHTKHTRRIGTRIDHVLAGSGLRCAAARVVDWPGADHSALVVELTRDDRGP